MLTPMLLVLLDQRKYTYIVYAACCMGPGVFFHHYINRSTPNCAKNAQRAKKPVNRVNRGRNVDREGRRSRRMSAGGCSVSLGKRVGERAQQHYWCWFSGRIHRVSASAFYEAYKLYHIIVFCAHLPSRASEAYKSTSQKKPSTCWTLLHISLFMVLCEASFLA